MDSLKERIKYQDAAETRGLAGGPYDPFVHGYEFSCGHVVNKGEEPWLRWGEVNWMDRGLPAPGRAVCALPDAELKRINEIRKQAKKPVYERP